MNDSGKWQEQNARYLSSALAWLRLRLERQVYFESSSLVQAGELALR